MKCIFCEKEISNSQRMCYNINENNLYDHNYSYDSFLDIYFEKNRISFDKIFDGSGINKWSVKIMISNIFHFKNIDIIDHTPSKTDVEKYKKLFLLV